MPEYTMDETHTIGPALQVLQYPQPLDDHKAARQADTGVVELPVFAGTVSSMGQLRQLGKLSQAQLAEKLSTKQPTVSQWERNPIGNMRLSTLMSVIEAIGATTEVRVVINEVMYAIEVGAGE